MALENLIAWLIVGGVAGWLAGIVMGTRQTLLANIVVGIIGGFVGGFIFDVLNIAGDVDGLNVSSIVVSFVGAVVLLFILKRLR